MAAAFHRRPARARRPTPPHRVRSCSTRGRRSTSTTTSTTLLELAELGGQGRRRALRPRRRLVPRPPRRHRRARRLARRPRRSGRTGSHRWSTAVRDLGMEFGLWFEPEMVNEDSELARAHPDWILAPGGACRLAARNQQVLEPHDPGGVAHVLEAMSTLIGELGIGYVKWDHNRDLVEAGDRSTGEPRVHAQTLAVYALMDELKRRHPGLEIESCSSGGGRVDLGVLEHTDRVWASDCIDAARAPAHPALDRAAASARADRQPRRRPDGAHHPSHARVAFRAATALFGHFGIEWDLRTARRTSSPSWPPGSPLQGGARPLRRGTTVRADQPTRRTGRTASSTRTGGCAVRLRRPRHIGSRAARPTAPAGTRPVADLPHRAGESLGRPMVRTRSGFPRWWAEPPTVLGEVLDSVGLQGPMLYPEQALLFRVVADGPASDSDAADECTEGSTNGQGRSFRRPREAKVVHVDDPVPGRVRCCSRRRTPGSRRAPSSRPIAAATPTSQDLGRGAPSLRDGGLDAGLPVGRLGLRGGRPGRRRRLRRGRGSRRSLGLGRLGASLAAPSGATTPGRGSCRRTTSR